MRYLPSELIDDVLSRLPANSLLRFRCVSRTWCALIDSPEFIKKHLNRTIQARKNLSLILSHISSRHIYSTDLDSLDRGVKLDHPLNSKNRVTHLWGSCNGLICFSNTDEEVVLWNPVTRSYRKLPASPIEDPPCECTPDFVVYGFGYDQSSDDYKVVRIVQFQGGCYDGFRHFEVKVYTLKSNSWRRVGDFPHNFELVKKPGLLANGVLYWKVYADLPVDQDFMEDGEVEDKQGLIIAFDLELERYRVVYEYSDSHFQMTLGVLDGCLCALCRELAKGERYLLMIKEYEPKESWSKLISFSPSNLVFRSDNLKPVTYLNEKKLILFENYGIRNRLLCYELETKKTECLTIQGVPDDVQTCLCFGSLVSLDDVIGGEEEKQAAKDRKKKEYKSWMLKQWGKELRLAVGQSSGSEETDKAGRWFFF